MAVKHSIQLLSSKFGARNCSRKETLWKASTVLFPNSTVFSKVHWPWNASRQICTLCHDVAAHTAEELFENNALDFQPIELSGSKLLRKECHLCRDKLFFTGEAISKQGSASSPQEKMNVQTTSNFPFLRRYCNGKKEVLSFGTR